MIQFIGESKWIRVSSAASVVREQSGAEPGIWWRARARTRDSRAAPLRTAARWAARRAGGPRCSCPQARRPPALLHTHTHKHNWHKSIAHNHNRLDYINPRARPAVAAHRRGSRRSCTRRLRTRASARRPSSSRARVRALPAAPRPARAARPPAARTPARSPLGLDARRDAPVPRNDSRSYIGTDILVYCVLILNCLRTNSLLCKYSILVLCILWYRYRNCGLTNATNRARWNERVHARHTLFQGIERRRESEWQLIPKMLQIAISADVPRTSCQRRRNSYFHNEHHHNCEHLDIRTYRFERIIINNSRRPQVYEYMYSTILVLVLVLVLVFVSKKRDT